ncbi:putative nucleic acid-binding Zn ribbon protein [Phyllobacterium ifriqiyense]|uniref:Nucleic acid-binding Zn ribbon protein n=1 Tax=Phyllobacterium ifriqiyense TaxID=314238 RepID=A0ABU0S5J2_9HYPH|nr:hypothetical protein [Phyllobacterium ifriqiyense]MDQ0996022.1 putative nucleic acid-binding Zn ribbon protein [Phyllobacterium ifriqiyense]
MTGYFERDAKRKLQIGFIVELVLLLVLIAVRAALSIGDPLPATLKGWLIEYTSPSFVLNLILIFLATATFFLLYVNRNYDKLVRSVESHKHCVPPGLLPNQSAGSIASTQVHGTIGGIQIASIVVTFIFADIVISHILR